MAYGDWKVQFRGFNFVLGGAKNKMLILMCVHDTLENKRSWMTKATLQTLLRTVNWDEDKWHRLIIIDNGSSDPATFTSYRAIAEILPVSSFELIMSKKNIGTAAGINLGLQKRFPEEHALKIDNDVTIHQCDWVDWIEEVFSRDPSIGICGLKRKDLIESPFISGPFKSKLRMLPHSQGQRWIIVEEVNGVMGTCMGMSSSLLNRIGYLNQPGLYGYDDSLASVRAKVAGFKRCFLHGFEIDHLDPGGDTYCRWKIEEATKWKADFDAKKALYESGAIDVYDGGGFEQ